jgi:hypothetical protein
MPPTSPAGGNGAGGLTLRRWRHTPSRVKKFPSSPFELVSEYEPQGDQPRAIDMRARHGRRIEAIPKPIMDEVLAKLATILE